MRISDWSSDVCSSDLTARRTSRPSGQRHARAPSLRYSNALNFPFKHDARLRLHTFTHVLAQRFYVGAARSEEHTSELQSLMRISYAVFCLKKKTNKNNRYTTLPNKRIRKSHQHNNSNRHTALSQRQ